MQFDDELAASSAGPTPAATPRKTPHTMDYEMADYVLNVVGAGLLYDQEREAIAVRLHDERRKREKELRNQLKRFGGDNVRLRYELIRLLNAHVREKRHHRLKIADVEFLKGVLLTKGMEIEATNALLKHSPASVAHRAAGAGAVSATQSQTATGEDRRP